MNRRIVANIAIVILLAALAAPQVALAGEIEHYPTSAYGAPAITWPSSWKPIPSLNDADDFTASGTEQVDFVGNADYPGVYYAGNSQYLFFRVRVDVGTVDASTFHDSIIILIDTADAGSVPDYGFAWDSKSGDITKHGLELMVPPASPTWSTWGDVRMDDADNKPADKNAPPDFNLTGDGYIRTLDGQNTGSYFGGTTTFIDFAISWAYLEANTTLRKGQSWNLQLVSLADRTDHNAVSHDVIGCALTDPYTCGWTSGTGFTANAIRLTNLAATSAPSAALLALAAPVAAVLAVVRNRRVRR